MKLTILTLVLICSSDAKRNRKRKSRRKIIQNDDETNHKILTDILNFMQDEPKTVPDPLEACEQSETECPVGYMCNVVRARTCSNGECILKKTTVCELNCQLTICTDVDQQIEKQRSSLAAARGKEYTTNLPPQILSTQMLMQAPTAISPISLTTEPIITDMEPTSGNTTSQNPLTTSTNITTSTTTPTSNPGTAVSEEGVATISSVSQTATTSTNTSDRVQVIKTSEVSRLNENCIYLREERLFECQNWKVSTIVSDLRRARNLSFKLPYTVREAMPDIDKPLHPEWIKIASEIVPPFTQEIVSSHVFTKCINEFFYEFYDKNYKSSAKLQFAAVLMVVKVNAKCKIPLTPLRKRLMLAAQRHFFRMVTKPRLAGFVHFLVDRTAGTPTVNPELEIKVLGPILAKLVARTVNRVWSKDEIYLKIVGDADYYSYKLPPALDIAVQKTLDEADTEPNLAKVTSLLVKNIHSEDLRRMTRFSYVRD